MQARQWFRETVHDDPTRCVKQPLRLVHSWMFFAVALQPTAFHGATRPSGPPVAPRRSASRSCRSSSTSTPPARTSSTSPQKSVGWLLGRAANPSAQSAAVLCPEQGHKLTSEAHAGEDVNYSALCQCHFILNEPGKVATILKDPERGRAPAFDTHCKGCAARSCAIRRGVDVCRVAMCLDSLSSGNLIAHDGVS